MTDAKAAAERDLPYARSPTMISGAWTDFLPGLAPGAAAVTELNPAAGRRTR